MRKILKVLGAVVISTFTALVALIAVVGFQKTVDLEKELKIVRGDLFMTKVKLGMADELKIDAEKLLEEAKALKERVKGE